MRLGELLVGRGLLCVEDIEQALRRQRIEGGRLGANLIALGLLTPDQLRILLQDQRDLDAALPLCRRTLARLEAMLGANHPNTSRARCNLARLLVAGGQPDEALPLAEAALVAQRAALGPKHPWTLDSGHVAAEAREAIERVEIAAAVPA